MILGLEHKSSHEPPKLTDHKRLRTESYFRVLNGEKIDFQSFASNENSKSKDKSPVKVIDEFMPKPKSISKY